MPYVVGLTGGIGSGKTTVSNLFADLGADVVDTDEIARALTAVGQPLVGKIAKLFGREYLTDEGALDRARMRERVFSDDKAKQDLEALLHPQIREQSARRIASSSAPYVILVVPLLFEAGNYRGVVQRVLVVDCDEEVQIERVMQRSNLTRRQVQAIMSAQVPRATRLQRADDVIRNDGNLDSLSGQVAALHRKYLRLAGQD